MTMLRVFKDNTDTTWYEQPSGRVSMSPQLEGKSPQSADYYMQHGYLRVVGHQTYIIHELDELEI